MKYVIFKLTFCGNVHFGNGTLDSTGTTFCADTLFSALCCESIRNKKSTEEVDDFVSECRSGRLKFSDAMPFCQDTLFIPKPFLAVKSSDDGDSRLKKMYKKMNYIPVQELCRFADGEMNPEMVSEMLRNMGTYRVRAMVGIRGNEDPEPFSLGEYAFQNGYGLYFIAAYENDQILQKIKDIMTSLSYSGIGGKRSSGLGRFSFEMVSADDFFGDKLVIAKDSQTKMSLSVCLPQKEEMESAIDNSSYSLIKRSGFVASYSYSNSEKFQKKNDLYVFKAGSCFENCFQGDIYDVSAGGNHPVYRYAIPMFLGVR